MSQEEMTSKLFIKSSNYLPCPGNNLFFVPLKILFKGAHLLQVPVANGPNTSDFSSFVSVTVCLWNPRFLLGHPEYFTVSPYIILNACVYIF